MDWLLSESLGKFRQAFQIYFRQSVWLKIIIADIAIKAVNWWWFHHNNLRALILKLSFYKIQILLISPKIKWKAFWLEREKKIHFFVARQTSYFSCKWKAVDGWLFTRYDDDDDDAIEIWFTVQRLLVYIFSSLINAENAKW